MNSFKSRIKYNASSIGLIFFVCVTINSFGQSDTIRIIDELRTNIDGKGKINIVQDKRIDELVDKHISQNKGSMHIPGYRIQIYSGSGKRSEAKRAKAEFMRHFPKVSAELIYVEPSFKVRVGHFRTKQEGYKLFKRICHYFPNAYFVIENEMEWPEIELE